MNMLARLFLLLGLAGTALAPVASQAKPVGDLLTEARFSYAGVQVNPQEFARIYRNLGKRSLWLRTSAGGKGTSELTRAGEELVSAIGNSTADGLDPSDYLGDFARSPEEAFSEIPATDAGKADLLLTRAYLRLAADLLQGRISQRSLPDNVVKAVDRFDPMAAIDMARSRGPERALDSFRPVHPQYAALKALLAGTKDAGKRRQIAINMERWRWLPLDLGRRHVLVNQPAYAMYLQDGGRQVDTRKVIIGKPEHQTPQFSARMEFAEFNPQWNVPPSIAVKDYLPKLRNNPGYLTKIGYTLFDGWGEDAQEIDGRKINWSRQEYRDPEKFPYRIVQGEGKDNALGQVKFLFPNTFDVYLHDTPAKKLFSSRDRAYSHGCIRVEQPLEFAEKLFSIDGAISPSAIGRTVASGERTQVDLRKPLTVHLAYFTVWVDEAGKPVFHRDVYGRDRALAKHF